MVGFVLNKVAGGGSRFCWYTINFFLKYSFEDSLSHSLYSGRFTKLISTGVSILNTCSTVGISCECFKKFEIAGRVSVVESSIG